MIRKIDLKLCITVSQISLTTEVTRRNLKENRRLIAFTNNYPERHRNYKNDFFLRKVV